MNYIDLEAVVFLFCIAIICLLILCACMKVSKYAASKHLHSTQHLLENVDSDHDRNAEELSDLDLFLQVTAPVSDQQQVLQQQSHRQMH